MQIAKATIEDFQDVHALINTLEEQTFDETISLSIYTKQCLDAHYYGLVCRKDSHVIGFCNLCFTFQLHHCEKIAEILEFVVDRQYRNQGVGTELFHAALEISRQNGCAQLELDTNQKRIAAHHFYETQGMHQTHYKYTVRL